MKRLNISPNELTSKDVGELQAALRTLKLSVQPSELARKELGATTKAAIAEFQRRAGLPTTGTLSADTVARLNVELAHTFVAGSKTRTRRFQELLQQTGIQVDTGEVGCRTFGASTQQALKQYQARAGLAQDGKVSEALLDRLREDALKARLASKNQVAQVHRTLLRALNIAKLDVRVDVAELRGKQIGPSTQTALKAVQQKYGLPATGQLDVATHDRLVSVAASIPQPTRQLKPKAAEELRPIKRVARLNMQKDHVADVQSALAFLGYQIEEQEFTRKTFGKSTRAAVVSYQRTRSLPVTGHVAGETLAGLNRDVLQANPQSAATAHSYRVRGSVRNELWEGLAGVTVQVWEKLINGQGAMLAERKSGENGFFDIPYQPPRDPNTAQMKQPFYLQIKAVDANKKLIGSKLLFNPTLIDWVNFTKGDQPYRGTSEFEARATAVSRAINFSAIETLVEKPGQPQISQVAQATGLARDDVMRLILAYLVAGKLKYPPLGAEACYAYLAQRLPPSLPGDLLVSTDEWALTEQLVDLAANGLVFMDEGLQMLAFENAITENLMPISIGRQKSAILAALAQLKQQYALEKPILIGNGSLKALLDASDISKLPQERVAAAYKAVANVFLHHKSFRPAFWTELNAQEAALGGATAVKDFQTTVDVGHIAKNFGPMVLRLKQKIKDPSVKNIKSPHDLAKLKPEDWVTIITENGSQVPPGTDGPNKVQTYAATLVSQSEQLFPAVALAARVGRSGSNPLPHIEVLQQQLLALPDFDLRTMNLDSFVKEHGINLDPTTLTEARVLQRVHRIAPTATAGQALLDQKIHNSSQIIAMGRERFVAALTEHGQVDRRTALTIYALAEHQYAQVLQRIADYRFDFHNIDPSAIIKYRYSPDELPPALAGIPDLETLFGSLDFCDCPHCQSVYGPPAYLADVLRYLDSHSSEVAGKTVKGILFDRRPDIGNIKLNCENTDTPLPYIDLVCEILENAVAAPNPSPNFSFQTTLTPTELRASPEHIRPDAYNKLKEADHPLVGIFNLWQEQARLLLQHLGVPRWELMEAFQSQPQAVTATPTDASIAGEYWGMSTRETAIITTQENSAARQNVYWGLSAIPTKLSVADFMRRSRLDYVQLLDLLYVRWLNPPDSANKLVIERPNATCNTENQKLAGLTVDCLDQIHRFLRLWRCTGWTMWELDLLLRTSAIGNKRIDGNTLAHLKQFKQLQQRLGLSVEQGLTFYSLINTEARVKADDPQRTIPSLYARLFLNQAVVSPIDTGFTLPIASGGHLSGHKATLLATFGLTEADLVRLLRRIASDDLTEGNLAKLCRYTSLAQGLGLRVKDLLTLEALSAPTDIFATPWATLDFIELTDRVSGSGFTIDELDYLLSYQPDSPYGLRDEVITQYIDALRESLRGNTANQRGGAIISQVATTFGLSTEQAQLLLSQVQLGGVSLLTHLGDTSLTARSNAGIYTTAIKPANFPNIYNTYRLLHKIALLLSKFKLSKANLEWLLKRAPTFKLLDLGALPVTGAPATALLPAWLNLYKWISFEGLYPQPEGISLREVFEKAALAATPAPEIIAAIAKLTQWTAQDLNDLATGLSLQHSGASSDYASIGTFLRLERCFAQLKRIGTSATMVLAWVKRDDDTKPANSTQGAQAITAQQIRQVVKSKYDYGVWLDQVTPLENALREKKRDALINYMVESSLRSTTPELVRNDKKYGNPAYWRDADDLLNYFLIDVQMSACQLTSRIKQAISSTQMFVQRCLLGLERYYVEVSRAEQQDDTSADSWKQWRWMQSYRLWEANRKVFLYPENWIEPELRDDKSPFFKELEAELMQQEITDENAQAAFLHYLQKVHEVARLDIVGAYHELDDTDPNDDDLSPNINLLHVVGRTRSHPAIYYYRQFDLNDCEWTAWEKIDLDIQSDHVVPVVYNRRLYLFWLTFIEKPQKVKKQPAAQPSNDTNVPETPNQLEIQLSWSARKDGGWTTRRVSAQKLIHPWQRPLYSYNLKPRYKSRENLLWLDIYISQSQEFNNTRFWDAYRNTRAFVTKQRYNEMMPPWHSSSFVFDGEVVDVKMKALAGEYHVLDSNGLATDYLTPTTSYNYVHDSFGAEGRVVNKLSGAYEIAPRLPLPDGMHYHNTRLASNTRTPNTNRANILEHSKTRTLLNGAKPPFEIVFSQHRIAFDTAGWGQEPFFYQDNQRAFFIRPEWQQVLIGYNQTLQTYNYEFYPFYHPYTALFMRELNRSGLEGLLNRRIQIAPQDYYPGNTFNFSSYSPSSGSLPDKTAINDRVDFERYGAYALYNWEIFFHAPLLIACKLSANQRFAEAMRWFHYIFDPTNVDSPDVPQRYWITRPFFEQNSNAYRQQRIEELLKNIERHDGELRAWKNNPYKPHLIARYRPVAYQKAVVMKYIDNLIAWGDQLFRRDTIEAINEATTLYVLAYEILGRRPIKVPRVEHTDRSYNELTADGGLDPFGNKRVEILMENFTGTPVRVTRTRTGSEPLPRLETFYFGIPSNDQLLEYWDRVEDRLFKIRHCMNIAGVVRQLPLFEPPIDPALLVKAAAAGIDPGSVLADIAAAPSPYRFRVLVQKAVELSSEVRALGDKLLAALEKNDAEGLALLRSTQEIRLLQAVREVRKQQIQEANATWAGLEKSKETAEQKQTYYQGKEFMNPLEILSAALAGGAIDISGVLALSGVLEAIFFLLPSFNVGISGFGGSPKVTVQWGTENIAKSIQSTNSALQHIGSVLSQSSSLVGSIASHQRRKEEWDFQAQLANTEIAQIEKQILAAQVRLAIAEKELENHELQIEHAQATDEYLRSKYSSQQLYDWQLRQLASIYVQSYQLAYDMAKRAEKSLQFELGDQTATFVQFGHWDGLKKGLLAGERLTNDIRRMEAAYLERNTRDLEITKHVSLAQLMPLSLIALKEAGTCTVTLPEWLFDMDYPGHYRRRIKSVAISIPCVVGPYTSVNCTLTLNKDAIRTTDSKDYGDLTLGTTGAPILAIATSHGQNDSGMFELNFNDERFLPFEGAGAVSEWRITLPRENNQFDLATISDVILHIRYTATASSTTKLIDAAKARASAALPSKGLRLFVLNHEFASAWQRFLHPDGGAEQTLSFTLGPEHLPFYARGKSTINLTSVDLIVESPDLGNFAARLAVPGATVSEEIPRLDPSTDVYGRRQHMAKSFSTPTALLGKWQLQLKRVGADFKSLKPEEIQNAYLVLEFKLA